MKSIHSLSISNWYSPALKILGDLFRQKHLLQNIFILEQRLFVLSKQKKKKKNFLQSTTQLIFHYGVIFYVNAADTNLKPQDNIYPQNTIILIPQHNYCPPHCILLYIKSLYGHH